MRGSDRRVGFLLPEPLPRMFRHPLRTPFPSLSSAIKNRSPGSRTQREEVPTSSLKASDEWSQISDIKAWLGKVLARVFQGMQQIQLRVHGASHGGSPRIDIKFQVIDVLQVLQSFVLSEEVYTGLRISPIRRTRLSLTGSANFYSVAALRRSIRVQEFSISSPYVLVEPTSLRH